MAAVKQFKAAGDEVWRNRTEKVVSFSRHRAQQIPIVVSSGCNSRALDVVNHRLLNQAPTRALAPHAAVE